MKVGLVLNSTGSKGAYEAGVIKALSDAKITFDIIAGSSSGALNAAMSASGQIDELVSIWEEKINLKSVFHPAKSGFFFKSAWNKSVGSNSRLRDLIAKSINIQQLIESKVKLVIMATNIQTGDNEAFVKRQDGKFFVERRDYVKEIGDKDVERVLEDALIASISIPIVFPPVKIVGQQYIDAGLANNTSLKEAIKSDCQTIFTILHEPQEHVQIDCVYKNLASIGARIAEISIKNSIEQDFQQAKMINQVIENWHKMSEEIISILNNTKNNSVLDHIQQIIQAHYPFENKRMVDIYCIQPEKDLNIGLFEFESEKGQKILRKGYQDGCRRIEELINQGKLEGLGCNRIECAVCDEKYAAGCKGKKEDKKFFDTIDRFIGKAVHHE